MPFRSAKPWRSKKAQLDLLLCAPRTLHSYPTNPPILKFKLLFLLHGRYRLLRLIATREGYRREPKYVARERNRTLISHSRSEELKTRCFRWKKSCFSPGGYIMIFRQKMLRRLQKFRLATVLQEGSPISS